jgi:hypothetical protein
VKRNAAASAGKNYDVYSLYHKKSGTIYDAGNFRKRSAAAAEAKIEMDRHNHPRGEHLRGRLA